MESLEDNFKRGLIVAGIVAAGADITRRLLICSDEAAPLEERAIRPLKVYIVGDGSGELREMEWMERDRDKENREE